jgi:RNA polymerase sigma-70 factor (ECF subfamily)
VYQSDPDVALMLSFRDGDEAAFDQLFQHWGGPLLRYMERMVGDAATAEELVQEAFFRVHKARSRYEPRARFSTWLYRIGTNLALNELKRPRRRHFHEEEENAVLVSQGPSSESQIDAQKKGTAVEQALENLPERQRMALWLSAAEGHSYAEVASILEITEKAVKALVHRGRTALVERLGSYEDDTPETIRRGVA